MSNKVSFREQMRGFPLRQMIVISLIRFLEPISFTSLFPYVYFMVRDFNVARDVSQIPRYSGYLAAGFSFMQFLCSVHWGQASDKIGRKYVLMIGSLGLACCMIIFGFSPNFNTALFARCAMGAVNGNVGVIRTSIGEIATQKQHQAVAFSTVPLLWSLGSVLGPLIGGSKYFTRTKNEADASGVYNDFLDKYPYALSNVVVAFFLVFSAICCFLFFEETHYKLKYRHDRGVEVGDALLSWLGYQTPVRPWHKPKRSEIQEASTPRAPRDGILDELDEIESPGDEYTPLNRATDMYDAIESEESEPESDGSDDYAAPISRQMSAAIIRRYSSHATFAPSFLDGEDVPQSIFSREVLTSQVLLTMLSNFLLSFQTLVYSEFLPVLMAGKLTASSIHFPFQMSGGFGYDSDSIGKLLSSTGFLGVIVVAVFFPWIDRNMSTINGYRLSLCLPPFVYLFLPAIILTSTLYNKDMPPSLTTILLYVNSAVNTLSTSTAFPHIVLLQHRAASPKYRALVNGFNLSLNALARCIAPLVWGWLISYTDSMGIVPVSWYILALSAMMSLVHALYMKNYDEEKTTAV